MSKRTQIAASSPSLSLLVKDRESVNIYIPDFTEDNALYEEVNSNNGVSIAFQKHELANIMRMRLNEVSAPDILPPSLEDDVILDAMFTKNDEIENIYQYAREREKEFKSK